MTAEIRAAMQRAVLDIALEARELGWTMRRTEQHAERLDTLAAYMEKEMAMSECGYCGMNSGHIPGCYWDDKVPAMTDETERKLVDAVMVAVDLMFPEGRQEHDWAGGCARLDIAITNLRAHRAAKAAATLAENAQVAECRPPAEHEEGAMLCLCGNKPVIRYSNYLSCVECDSDGHLVRTGWRSSRGEAIHLWNRMFHKPIAKPSPVEPKPEPVEFDEDAARAKFRDLGGYPSNVQAMLQTVELALATAKPLPAAQPTDAEIGQLQFQYGFGPLDTGLAKLIRAALAKWPVRAQAVEWSDEDIWHLWHRVNLPIWSPKGPLEFARALLDGGK